MSADIAQQIVEALRIRAERIRIADGYQTDAGARVFIRRPLPPEEDMPCIVLFDEEATAGDRRGQDQQTWTQDYGVLALARAADPDNPGRTAGALRADLLAAILDPEDPYLSGLAVDIRPVNYGVDVVEPSMVTLAYLNLTITYISRYGDPYN